MIINITLIIIWITNYSMIFQQGSLKAMLIIICIGGKEYIKEFLLLLISTFIFQFIIDEPAFSVIDPRIFLQIHFHSFHTQWTLTICSSIIQVDFMLGSYMDDIGISSKQFEDACGKGSKRSFQHGLFEQVRLFYPFSLSLWFLTWPLSPGLGRGGLWDFQANDDPEKYWTSTAGSGAASTKVRGVKVLGERLLIDCQVRSSPGLSAA